MVETSVNIAFPIGKQTAVGNVKATFGKGFILIVFGKIFTQPLSVVTVKLIVYALALMYWIANGFALFFTAVLPLPKFQSHLIICPIVVVELSLKITLFFFAQGIA